MPEIRPRRAADLDQCAEALWPVHELDAYPLEWPADPLAWLAVGDAAWVAELPAGTIAGHLAVYETPDGFAEISRLFVTPAARGHRIAQALIGEARVWAAAHERSLKLNVVEGNRSPAIAFYEATGWRHTHTTTADWTTSDGGAVRLRHYVL